MSEFHGTKQAAVVVRTEQPWHRVAAFLFASGASTRDVAEATDKTPTTVLNLLRQSWFQSQVAALIEKNGATDILTLFKAEQFNSFATMVELRDDDRLSSTVRLKAAADILDRAMGKAVQRVESSVTRRVEADPVLEEQRLKEEQLRLLGDQRRLGLC